VRTDVAAGRVLSGRGLDLPRKPVVEHTFGGPWTEIKLDAVQYYLECYTKALKRVGFDLTYIDAFAGTGSRVTEGIVGGFFETPPETNAGSARRAIAVQPPFDHYLFIEKDPEWAQTLAEIEAEHPRLDIKTITGDANEVLRKLVRQEPWLRRDASRSRGVVFLDPYALQVDWKTVRALASTHVLDVWYLFPIRDTIRQLARDFSGIGPKAGVLDRVLSPEWRELYRPAPKHGFFHSDKPELRRSVTPRQFEQWLKQRLEQEFAFVSEPLPILTSPARQAFSLFLGVSNPGKAATDLARKFVLYVSKHFGPGASHRKSGRAKVGR
jgi:three-Cys-motif partner protein